MNLSQTPLFTATNSLNNQQAARGNTQGPTIIGNMQYSRESTSYSILTAQYSPYQNMSAIASTDTAAGATDSGVTGNDGASSHGGANNRRRQQMKRPKRLRDIPSKQEDFFLELQPNGEFLLKCFKATFCHRRGTMEFFGKPAIYNGFIGKLPTRVQDYFIFEAPIDIVNEYGWKWGPRAGGVKEDPDYGIRTEVKWG